MHSKKGLAVFASLALVCAFAIPTAAFAANISLQIDGTEYHSGTAAEAENGSWSYDGDSTLTLNNYNGDQISVSNDYMDYSYDSEATEETDLSQTLNIVLKGKNTITSESTAISSNYVDINITSGEENASLDATTKGECIELGDSQGCRNVTWGAIGCEGGNLNIVDTVVNAIWNTDSTYADINEAEYEYDTDIVDGAITVLDGNINIINSTVKAVVNASGNKVNNLEYKNYKYACIVATGSMEMDGGNITIDNSNVTATSPDFSILAMKLVEGETDDAGSITVKNDKITTPESGKVTDVCFDNDDFYKSIAAHIMPMEYYDGNFWVGQTIATADAAGTITELDQEGIASKAVLTASKTDPENNADNGNGSTVPKTADSAPIILIGAMLAAGFACMVLSRKKKA